MMKYGNRLWSRDWRKGHPETAPPGGSIPYSATKPGKPGHYFGYQEVLVDRSLIWLSPERLFQSLTNTEAEALSQTLDWPQGFQMEELGRALKYLRRFAAPWREQECQLLRPLGAPEPPTKEYTWSDPWSWPHIVDFPRGNLERE